MRKIVFILAALSIVLVLATSGSSAFSASLSAPVESVDPIVPIIGIYAGYYSESYFVLRSDGSLWAWGQNDSGQLGDGTNESIYADVTFTVTPASTRTINEPLSTPRTITLPGETRTISEPRFSAAVRVMDGVKDVSAGMGYTLIVKTDGTLWGCGSNIFSQIGNSTERYYTIPVKIMEDVRQASAGAWHSLVVKEDGSLWSFGCNSCGQLGTGNKGFCGEPQKVMEGVRYVQAGGEYSLAIKEDNTLWAWGDNQSAQLGDGTKLSRSTPKKIMDGVILAATSVNGEVSMSKKNELISTTPGYSVWTGNKWKNFSGHWDSLGMPDTTYSQFSGSTSYAVKSDGTLWAWGENDCVQMGNHLEAQMAPVQIMSDVLAICAGDGYSLAIKKDGSLWICGNIELSEDDAFNIGRMDRHNDSGEVEPEARKAMVEGVCSVAGGREGVLLLKRDGGLSEFYPRPNPNRSPVLKTPYDLGLIPQIANVPSTLINLGP